MFKNRIDEYKYLEMGGGTLRIGAGYICNRTSRHSIWQWLPCLLPSEVFLGWQYC